LARAIVGVGLVCCAEVDATRYVEGETGTATFSNPFSEAVYLDGCGHFTQEQLASGKWNPLGGEHVCVWEGYAQPVEPKASISEPFGARDPGVWRLAYTVGFRCDGAHPLSQENCLALRTIYTERFEVAWKEPTDQELCEGTGGRWDPNSCGHYPCGDFPSCDAVIPGCDCGPLSNFREGEGCRTDPGCGLE
jgi:hypothetical protein